MPRYETIFDLSTEAFQWTPCYFALALATAGVVIRFLPGVGDKERIAGMTLAFFALLVCGYFALQFARFTGLRNSLVQQDYAVVDGRVVNFREPAVGSHGPYTFSVSGRSFEIWPNSYTSKGFAHVISGQCSVIRYAPREGEVLWMAIAPPNENGECS